MHIFGECREGQNTKVSKGHLQLCCASSLIPRQLAAGYLIDLDLKMRKSEDIHFLRDGMHLGDGVHLNEAGGKVITETFFEKSKSEETL